VSDELKVWYVEYYNPEGRELFDTKVCSRNYITARAWALRDAKEQRAAGIQISRIRLECYDSFKVYNIAVKG
jgi:hypothetical protein